MKTYPHSHFFSSYIFQAKLLILFTLMSLFPETNYLESDNFEKSNDAVKYLKQYHLKLSMNDLIEIDSDFIKKFRIYCMNSFSVHPEKYIIIIDNQSQIYVISGFDKNHFNKLFQKGLISVNGNQKLIASIIDLYVKTAMPLNQDEEYLKKTLQIIQTKNEFVVEFQTKSFKDDRIHTYKLYVSNDGIKFSDKK